MLERGVGTGRGRAAGAGEGHGFAGGGTPVPRGERAPTPVAAHACGTRYPRRGPAVVAGKPTVRRAQLPGGNRMTEKRMPVAERRRESTRAGPALQLVVVDNRPDTGPRGPAAKAY